MEKSKSPIKKKKFEMPSSIAILILLTIALAILTHLIPAGEYTRVDNDCRNIYSNRTKPSRNMGYSGCTYGRLSRRNRYHIICIRIERLPGNFG